MSDHLQRDFGGFNPKFLGITLRVDDERFWQRVLQALTGGGDTLVAASRGNDRQYAEAVATATVLALHPGFVLTASD